MNKSELLEKVRAGRQKLNAALSQLTDEQMVIVGLNDGWSTKDLLAHLGWWEWRAATNFDSLIKHGQITDGIDGAAALDALNAKAFADNHDKPLAEVRQYEQDAYRAITTLLDNASDDDLFSTDRFPWMKGRAFVEWIAGNTYGHYDEHIDALTTWVKTLNQARSA